MFYLFALILPSSFSFLLKKNGFDSFLFGAAGFSCDIQNLRSSMLQHVGSLAVACEYSSLTRIPVLGAWGLSHWTTREVPKDNVLKY